ncbi:DUF3887 domain-containing protein [Clostridium massiliamazoniense]|uniref:DUF3887 domain-containing protein n=1 Tax=Clostridium massiliamazoniense TaxID=1347366 RepID=UPI0006D84CBD|nr:DUF3887 domain-containing protein [Clostridium massiliamazoniense]
MKNICKVLVVMLLGTILVSCGVEELSDNFNEGTLREAVENIVDELNNQKYEEIVVDGIEEVKGEKNVNAIKETWEKVTKNLGKYEKIEKMVFQEKDDLAIVISVLKFEKGKVQLTTTFNKENKLAGIFMK